MTDTQQTASAEITGEMFLYSKPELLNKEQHSSMGFKPVEHPFKFAGNERAVPLTMTEFSSAMRHYPIIFSGKEDPVPLAVLGIAENENQFVDANGQWEEECYVPMYLRCYPFALAAGADGQMAVIVDTAAAVVSNEPQYPFFTDGELSEHSDAMMQACAAYETERQRTQQFCAALKEHDLLFAAQATHTPEGETEALPYATYVGIDSKKVGELSEAAVYDLHTRGFLSAIYLHLYSMPNWRRLVMHNVGRPSS
jgi:hypothetical protein